MDKTLDRLNAHRAWANGLLNAWCFAPPEPDAYCAKMMSHILLGEAAWIARIRGVVPARGPWEMLEAGQAADLREANEAAWEDAMASDLGRRFRYTRFTGEACESSVADIVTHVCTHGMYHRGQIAAQAARLGLKVPSTDFIVFTRE